MRRFFVFLLLFVDGCWSFFGCGGVLSRVVFLPLALFFHGNAEGERQLRIGLTVDTKVKVAITARPTSSITAIFTLGLIEGGEEDREKRKCGGGGGRYICIYEVNFGSRSVDWHMVDFEEYLVNQISKLG